MYWCCIYVLFCMYFVWIACISQNVCESMRLTTFVAKNTSKYIQYRHIHTSYIHQICIIHTPNTYKISQLLCVSMCIYMHVFACIFLCVSMCMYYYVTMCIYKHVLCYYFTVCIYVNVFACMCLYYVCMTVFHASKDMIWLACSMCMYLLVFACINWPPLFTVV